MKRFGVGSLLLSQTPSPRTFGLVQSIARRDKDPLNILVSRLLGLRPTRDGPWLRRTQVILYSVADEATYFRSLVGADDVPAGQKALKPEAVVAGPLVILFDRTCTDGELEAPPPTGEHSRHAEPNLAVVDPQPVLLAVDTTQSGTYAQFDTVGDLSSRSHDEETFHSVVGELVGVSEATRQHDAHDEAVSLPDRVQEEPEIQPVVLAEQVGDEAGADGDAEVDAVAARNPAVLDVDVTISVEVRQSVVTIGPVVAAGPVLPRRSLGTWRGVGALDLDAAPVGVADASVARLRGERVTSSGLDGLDGGALSVGGV